VIVSVVIVRDELDRDSQSSIVECGDHGSTNRRRAIMLSWALTFLVVALIAAVLGFGGLAGEAAWVAHVLFVVFLILFLVSAISGRRMPPA
jgi:uncharacterized membrane protein YtjA (UPF0391 family)